ncbi:hypothetical protein RUND412_009473 [Rhizina undulata]
MTNWRERGYVPASDGEESDGELSTQEDQEPFDIQSERNTPDEVENGDAVSREKPAEETVSEVAVLIDGGEDIAQIASENVASDDFRDIEKVLSGIAGVMDGNADGDAGRREREVSVVDLSNQVEESDEDHGGVQLRAENGNSGEADTPKPLDEEMRNVSSASPDPITGEPQKLRRNIEETPAAPRAQNFTDNAQPPPYVSLVQSSPLSSVPPSPEMDTEIAPPSSIVPPNRRLSGFEVLIPIQQHPPPPPPPPPPSADSPSGPIRSLRQRKPIQLNPYLIEQERYRQTLKARGLQPVRIHEVLQDDHQHAGKKDSQEEEYVAPPERERDGQTRIQRAHVSAEEVAELIEDLPEEDEFPDVANLLRYRPRPNGSLSSGVKRRKVYHTYSRHDSGASTSRTKPTQSRKSSSEHRRIAEEHGTTTINRNSDNENEMNIYDFPPSPSPTRPARAPLTQRSLNPPIQETQGLSVSPVRNAPKNRGLLSVLDSSDTEPEPSRPSRLIQNRSVSPALTERPRALSISSSSSASSSSSSSNSTGSSEEEDVTKIRKLQRKTNGVLPASWWRLDQTKQVKSPAGLNGRNRDRRRSTTPTRETTPKPGVARVKVSSRPRSRTPEADVFLLGDYSDESSDEPILIVPPATAPPARDREVQVRQWVNFEDVMEDDRIDPMLPRAERRRQNPKVTRKKRQQGTLPSASAPGQNNIRKYAVSRPRTNSSAAFGRSEQPRPAPTLPSASAPGQNTFRNYVVSRPKTNSSAAFGRSEKSRPAPWARRKNTPRRIDADIIERRQPPQQDVVVSDDEPTQMDFDLVADHRPILSGLSPPGFKYSLNFDTIALKAGTLLNGETFIGGGGLARALDTQPAQGSRANRGSAFTFGDMVLHWGVYEDSVASEFETVTEKITDMVEKAQERDLQGEFDETEYHIFATQAYSFYGFFARYLAEVLSFPDSVDLVSFGQRVLQAVGSCSDRISSDFGREIGNMNIRRASTRLCLRTHAFSLLFAYQISRLSAGDPEMQARLELSKYFRKLGHHLLRRLLKCGLDGVIDCYEDQRRRSSFERGIGYEHYLVESWIMAMKVLDHIDITPEIGFLQLLNVELRLEDLEKSCDVRAFEKCWRLVFTLLPLYQFDNSGVALQCSDSHHPPENWALMKVLASRPLQVYNANKEAHSGTINDYCRIIYARCHHLIAKWFWTNPEIIVPVLYEFFASNSLANLKNEMDYGSPNFLQNLDRNPSVEVVDSDRCFHLLLKTIAVALLKMKSTSNAKKISSLVNRLMPNHRRHYPKEDELQVEHLTALRNHHDLLVTLYWAAPPECRPPLDAVRNLVDPETSHRQACHVSIRAWLNLLRFQLHSDECVEALAPLMEWFDELTNQTLNQHNGVKSEAEKQFNAAKAKGDTEISEDQLQDIIRRNQRQLEGILSDAVKSLGAALAGINGNIQNAMAILTKASISNIIASHNKLSHKLILEVLEILQKYLNICTAAPSAPPAAVQANDDSQDYGDWSAYDDLIFAGERKNAAEHLMNVAYDSLHRMLSNCFGADKQPEESLLVKIVDTWSRVAGFMVQYGLKTWDAYLNSYSRESWSSLRDTEQTRKFIAYFMPKIIQAGKANTYESNKNTLLSYWMRTLVERESMLKYQNEFTATLLNVDETNPILKNLPFVRDEVNGVYKISAMDFKTRRLSVITTVLANMRESHELALQESSAEAARLKLEYADILKAMMKAMRENYEELQSKAVSGAYVEFVQKVIESLQHHTIDLVTVDKYFTDSSAFPLPATDPTYVIGKLKHYGLKLAYPRSHKQLIFFFYSVCERAAIDGQQEYLVSQLATALSGDFEAGDRARPTLRTFFLQAVFPTYVERAFGPVGWILAAPILTAAEEVVGRLVADVDSTVGACVGEVLGGLACLVDAVRRGVGELMESPEMFNGRNMGMMVLILKLITKIMPIVDWLSSVSSEKLESIDVAISSTSFLLRVASYIRTHVTQTESTRPVDVRGDQIFPGAYDRARTDCEKSLKETLAREWNLHLGEWYVVRGASRRAVKPPALPGERVERVFVRAFEEAVRVACRTERFGGVARELEDGIWEMERRGWSWGDRVRGRRNVRAVRGLADVFC